MGITGTCQFAESFVDYYRQQFGYDNDRISPQYFQFNRLVLYV